jgi:hypothetical protein
MMNYSIQHSKECFVACAFSAYAASSKAFDEQYEEK